MSDRDVTALGRQFLAAGSLPPHEANKLLAALYRQGEWGFEQLLQAKEPEDERPPCQACQQRPWARLIESTVVPDSPTAEAQVGRFQYLGQRLRSTGRLFRRGFHQQYVFEHAASGIIPQDFSPVYGALRVCSVCLLAYELALREWWVARRAQALGKALEERRECQDDRQPWPAEGSHF